jgi:hypothetical protein
LLIKINIQCKGKVDQNGRKEMKWWYSTFTELWMQKYFVINIADMANSLKTATGSVREGGGRTELDTCALFGIFLL